MWLSNEIYEWTSVNNGGTIGDEDLMRRAYKIWGHAESLLKQQTDFALVDSIANLKRAINHRLKMLNSIYGFATIPVQNKPKRLLEQLAYFGIVRPTMLNTLITIRNKLEHEDADPPPLSRCYEFADVTWYFLRTTDRFITLTCDAIQLTPQDEPYTNSDYWLEVSTGPHQNWSVEIRGWVPPSIISQTFQPNWLPIDVTNIKTRRDWQNNLEAQGIEWDTNGIGRGCEDNDITFQASAKIAEPIWSGIFSCYFNSI